MDDETDNYGAKLVTISEPSWFSSATNLILANDEVHVWCASLDLPASRLASLYQTLTADELNRADQFFLERDRRRFMAARGLLRTILGRYLGLAPNQLRFIYGDHGKPALAPTPGQASLSFNLSHSAGLALYAVTSGREVGVDLERICSNFDFERLAARFFSVQENAILRALPAALKPEAFFNCWTRKEAYIKARGKGLALPLNQFDVSLTPGEPAKLLETRGDRDEASRWSLQALKPDPDYAAALAVAGHGWRFTCWQWPE